MKAYQVTIGLLCILIALFVASWGRFIDWLQDVSPIKKAVIFVCSWALLIAIGYRNGQVWMFAGFMVGYLFVVGLVIHFIVKEVGKWEQ